MISEPSGNTLPLRHQRIGAHQAAGADLRAVQNRGAHPDQRPGGDAAAVQDCVMPDGDIRANRQRGAEIGMQHGAFLDVAALADIDELVMRHAGRRRTRCRQEAPGAPDP